MSRTLHFIRNVLWNWAEVGLSIFAALILAPIVIRRLGDEDYGMWTLTVSLVEYYWLLDLGLRGATIKYSAHYNALGDKQKLNSVINTSMAFALSLAPLVVLSVLFAAPYLASHFHVEKPVVFSSLVILAVSSWALGSIGSSFSATLEGLQRFDLTSQAYILTTATRNFGVLILLLSGFGVVEMARLTLLTQGLLVVLNFVFLHHALPDYKLSLRFANRSTLRELFSYGVHGVTASIGQRILNQSTPLLTGYYLSSRETGYFSAPSKLVDYSLEVVSRIGVVSNPNAAEFMAQGRYDQLYRMAMDASRYSLTLYMPVALFLLIYGHPLMSVWISPDFANKCAGVLPALVTGGALAIAAQYSSGSILFGMGKHRTYSRMLLGEGLLTIGFTIAALKTYGIVGAAWVRSAFMLLCRGFGLSYLLNKELNTNLWTYWVGVYTPPLTAAVPVAAMLLWMRHSVLPGSSWWQLIVAGLLSVISYFLIAYHVCLRKEHRQVFRGVTARLLNQ